jgi:2-amino-4-hydroxy-6-hydroxymethyldihydropteridine diphosphokinase
MAVAYLGLGGNLGDPIDTFKKALAELMRLDGISITGVSRLYRTKPVGGPTRQPDYINAVVAILCSLGPDLLLARCLSIEESLGRVRLDRWGPRTIDIDILLYDDVIVDDPGLVIPHPMLRKRLFALMPLADVAPPEMTLPPDGITLRNLTELTIADAVIAIQQPFEIIETKLPVPVASAV